MKIFGIHFVGPKLFKMTIPGIVKFVENVEIGVNGIVKTVTDVHMGLAFLVSFVVQMGHIQIMNKTCKQLDTSMNEHK